MGDKKGSKKSKAIDFENADTSKMSFKQLQNFCVQLFDEITEERKEAERYELERDKLVIYWSYTGDKLRQSLYDLRDQQLCLENDEFALNTRVTRKIEEGRRHKADASETIQNVLITRGASIEKQHETILEMNHQIWSDVFDLKSKIFDVEISKSEALTDQKYVEQNHLEIITKNMVKQRKMDMKRLKKEMSKAKKNYLNETSENFRQECYLKENIMKAIIKNNNCSFNQLISTFERIVNYNFEKVSVLKEKAEKLKKLDIMLSKEYSEASKKFFNAVSSQAESIRTLGKMRTFLYAAGKTEKSLKVKMNELKSNENEAELLSVKCLNNELIIKQLEARLKELTDSVIHYRRFITEVVREDEEILSGEIEQLLIKLYDHKCKLYSLISPEKKIDFKYEAADVQDLSYRTQNIGEIQCKLQEFRNATSAIVAIFNRLFKIWDINYEVLEIIPKKIRTTSSSKYENKCNHISNYKKW